MPLNSEKVLQDHKGLIYKITSKILRQHPPHYISHEEVLRIVQHAAIISQEYLDKEKLENGTNKYAFGTILNTKIKEIFKSWYAKEYNQQSIDHIEYDAILKSGKWDEIKYMDHKDLIDESIKKLNNEDKRFIKMRYYDELNLTDIAKKEKISIEYARIKIIKAEKRLKEIIIVLNKGESLHV